MALGVHSIYSIKVMFEKLPDCSQFTITLRFNLTRMLQRISFQNGFALDICKFFLLGVFVWFFLSPNHLFGKEKPKIHIGLNLSGVTEYATQLVFTNAFMSSRPWTGEKIGVQEYYRDGLDIDDSGWVKSLKPGETAFSLMFVDIDKKYPKGKYLLTYDGDGRLQFKWNVFILRQGDGYFVLDVHPDDAGIEIRITETNSNNPIRNFRLMLPNHWEQRNMFPFHPLFLDKVKDFSIYRFMDWQETNNSKISSWDERPKVTDASFSSGKGVPLEYMVLLCNLQNISPWFNIPHLANDDYVEKYATYVKDHLKASLNIYVEYSNEMWNTTFTQHRFAVNMGKKLGLSENDFTAYARFYSQRSVEIFSIWKRIFGGSDRLKFVMAGQIGNTWLTKQVLDWKNAYKTTNAYAVAPYFGGKFGYDPHAKRVRGMSIAEFEVELKNDVLDVMRQVYRQSEDLKEYRIPMFAYEGGQHLVGAMGNENDDLLNQIFDKVNRDGAMKRLYSLYLKLWEKSGGDVMMIFSSIAKQSKWGRWGMTENMYIERARSPKLDAILEFKESE